MNPCRQCSPAIKLLKRVASSCAIGLNPGPTTEDGRPAASFFAVVRRRSAFLKRVAQIDATRCPHCALGRWRTLETLRPADVGGDGSAGSAGKAGKAQAQVPCRGPP